MKDNHSPDRGTTLSFEAYGLTFRIGVPNEKILERVRLLLPPGSVDADVPSPDIRYSLVVQQSPDSVAETVTQLYEGEQPITGSPDVDVVLSALETQLRRTVSVDARKRVFVHAGAVGWKGGGMVIPGPSHSGKTSLVRELVRLGTHYYSDEFAVLDAKGWLYPFAEALQVRNHAGGPKVPLALGALGGEAGIEPVEVKLVVKTHYREGATWRPRELRPGQMSLHLVANAFAATRSPAAVLTAATAAVKGACLLGGPRGDAREVAVLLLERLESASTPRG